MRFIGINSLLQKIANKARRKTNTTKCQSNPIGTFFIMDDLEKVTVQNLLKTIRIIR